MLLIVMAMQKYDITYVERTLNELRFTSSQRKELLAAIEGKPSFIEAFTQFLPIFLGNKQDFSHSFIIGLVTAKNGFENINIYNRFYLILSRMKLRFADIKRITEKHSPKLIFPLIAQNRSVLKQNNMGPSDIVKLCEMTENINELKKLMPFFKSLERLNISKRNIIFLMKHNLIECFLTFNEKLPIHSFPNEILDLYIQESSTLNQLVCLFNHSVFLQSLNIPMSCVFEFCSQPNIIELTHYVQTFFPNLLMRNFDLERLCQLLVAENGIQNIEMLFRLAPILSLKGYGNEAILSLVEHKNGALYLQRLYVKHSQFFSKDCTSADIFKMVVSEIEKEECLVDNDLSSYLKEIEHSRRFFQNKLSNGAGLSASEYADYLVKEYEEWRDMRESSSPKFF